MGEALPELVLDFPNGAPPAEARQIRSTLIASSLASLRAHGLFERYSAHLDDAHRDAILGAVAGQWLAMSVGRAHYEACERLGLTVAEQIAIGEEVSQKIHDTFLGVVIRMARDVGVTPWTLLTRGNQMISRLFSDGGGVRVAKHGPKEARVDIAGLPLLSIPYFRHALRGIYSGAVTLFCARAYVTEVVRATKPNATTLKVAWA